MIPITELSKYLPDPDTVSTSVKQQMRDNKREIIRYLNIPICFDLESYSFRECDDKGELTIKRAVMWAYGVAIGDTPLIGRTWGSFVDALNLISDHYELHRYRRVIIWVHNLGYDFQFFRKWLNFEQVFSLDPRRPCYALTDRGIEFRCSYILTGYALEKVADNLLHHTVRKLVGEIDYTLPRHTYTPLTDKEIAYIENDTLVVTAHIQEQMEIEKGLAHIPLTKTGYVRRYVRKSCFRNSDIPAKKDFTRLAYTNYMQTLQLDSFQYESCKRAFQGGFTHANPCYTGKVMTNVTSLDIISCYPAQILSGLYPVTPPKYIEHFDSKEDFEKVINNSCCIFTVTLYNVEPLINYDHPLSYSRCDIPKDKIYQLSNGRIVKAEELTTTITNIDYFIIRKCYKWGKIKISGFITWGWGYLPKPIIESTLYMYEQKTRLKGDKDKKIEYMSLKEMLNSIYGMMVTDPLRPEIPYEITTAQWGKIVDGLLKYKVPLTEDEKNKALNDYNTDNNRFTYYPWGVFITAYARHMLWSAILEFKDDYIYSDTDSVKVKNYAKHKDFILRYNAYMEKKIATCLKYYGIDPERAKPVSTKDNSVKSLGTWDLEDPITGTDYTYRQFKTLGAKRYMVRGADGLSITVSGINKEKAVPFIKDYCRGVIDKDGNPIKKSDKVNKKAISPFEFFTKGMEIPPGYAGKLIPFYGDEEIQGVVTDYLGNGYEYYEKSFVNMENGGYELKISKDYVEYLTLLARGFLF